MNISRNTSRIAGLTLAGALTATVLAPATAAPFMANAAAVRAATQSDVVDVRWRGGYAGGAIAAGVIGGLALGAAAASAPYYGQPAYYGRPYYGPSTVYHYDYGYAPSVYPAPYYSGGRDRNAPW